MEENLDNLIIGDWERSLGFSSEDPETVSMQGIDVPTDTSVGAYAEGVGRTWGEMLRGALAGTFGAGGDIESILSNHPKIAESAVLAFPDAMRGEVAAAVVSLKEGMVATEQELRHFCLERIANYKVPKQVIFLKSLPRTAGGQIDKEAIRVLLSVPPIHPYGIHIRSIARDSNE